MYEITFITKEEKDDTVKRTIENLGGKIFSENKMGRKKFAYPIKKEEAGFYCSYIFELDQNKINELNKALFLKNQVLRHLVVVSTGIKETIKPESEIKKTKSVKTVPQKTKIIKEEKETKESEKTKTPEKPEKKITQKTEKLVVKEKEEKNIKPIPKKTEKPASPKTELTDEEERLKALEEKLEEILKE